MKYISDTKYIQFLAVMALALLLAGCATRGAPGGGPPDKTGPEVVRTFPPADSVLVDSLLQYIEIEFSEPVLEGPFNQSLFVSPPLRFEIDWQEAEVVRLLMQDTLRPQQTYVITIGAGTTDEHDNKMKSSYSFAFSTGRKIDRGSISGTIYDLDGEQTAAAFAYLLDDTMSVDPTRQKPLYVSQSGKNGGFRLNYLKEGCYRIFAVEDINNNLLYDAKYERIGVPYRDACVDSTRPVVVSMDFHLSKSDTVPPDLVGARATDNRTIRLRFSEPVVLPDSGFVTVADSLTGTPLPVLAWYGDEKEENNVRVYTQTMDSAAYYRVRLSALSDKNGNVNPAPAERVISASLRRDTTRFRLKEITPADSAKNVHPETHIQIEFSSPADWGSVGQGFALIASTGDTLAGSWQPLGPLSAEFIPRTTLHTDSVYTIVLRLGATRDLWGNAAPDTVVRHLFTVISNRELGEISGKVIWSGKQPAPVILHIRKAGQSVPAATLRLNEPGSFFKDALMPGKYLLDGFVDLNDNGRYDSGSLQPFEYAEPFYFSGDTVRVRKRWETSDVILEIPADKNKN